MPWSSAECSVTLAYPIFAIISCCIFSRDFQICKFLHKKNVLQRLHQKASKRNLFSTSLYNVPPQYLNITFLTSLRAHKTLSFVLELISILLQTALTTLFYSLLLSAHYQLKYVHKIFLEFNFLWSYHFPGMLFPKHCETFIWRCFQAFYAFKAIKAFTQVMKMGNVHARDVDFELSGNKQTGLLFIFFTHLLQYKFG